MLIKYLRKIKPLVKLNMNYQIYKVYFQDYKKFRNYWIESSKNINTVGYKIILEGHALEKGMTIENPRYFGIEKVKNIMSCISTYDENNWEKDYAYNFGLSLLKSYCTLYEKKGWVNRDEYKQVSLFLNNKKYINIDAGSIKIRTKDFINDAKIDYNKFLSSRHSVRNFKKERIKKIDVEKAINMAIKSPTACNRQMCKIYYISDEIKRKKILKYGHGLTNFNLENVNIFVITFDIHSLCSGEDRHQGWFNAGLVGMNFVNALHSLGIGTCFIQYGNSYQEEKEMNSIIGIPSNEKVAVMIAAGYYNDYSIIPYSARKNIKEIMRIV